MSVMSNAGELAPCPRAVLIGTFDGVHLGHRELIRRAAATSMRVTAVTFDPHPRRVFGQDVRTISSLRRRVELLLEAGAQDVLVTSFTAAVAGLEAADWAAGVLVPIGTQHLVVGAGFRFGYRRAGDAALLRRMRFSVDEVPLRAGTSSSRVREMIAAGDLRAAERELGRPFELEGLALAEPLPTSTATTRIALQVDAGAAMPPSGTYHARLPHSNARMSIRGRRIELLAPADAAPAPGSRVCVGLTGGGASAPPARDMRSALRRVHRVPVASIA